MGLLAVSALMIDVATFGFSHEQLGLGSIGAIYPFFNPIHHSENEDYHKTTTPWPAHTASVWYGHDDLTGTWRERAAKIRIFLRFGSN